MAMTALSHSTPYWRDMQCSAILGYTLQPNDVIVESLDRDAEPMLVVENTLSRSKMHYNQYSVTYHNGQRGEYYDMPPELWESDDEQDPSGQPNCQQLGCAELPPHGHWLVGNAESDSLLEARTCLSNTHGPNQ